MADSGLVDFHAEKIFFRLLCGHSPGCITVAKTNFHDNGMFVAVQGTKIQFTLTVRDSVLGPQFFESTFLTICQPPPAQDETPNRTPATWLTFRVFFFQ
jgi:hypothetical protein